MTKNGRFYGKVFHAIGGENWRNVHSADKCAGENCVIHNPSEHCMRNWRMHLRETTLVERICEHGIGHPDPDSVKALNKITGQTSWGIHGCDGCCYDPYRTLD